MRVLDSIIAVGFPYAAKIGAELSAYHGKVNAIHESGCIPMLSIDAKVNPGNSGGPVLNDRGEVVKIVVGKVDETITESDGDDKDSTVLCYSQTLENINLPVIIAAVNTKPPPGAQSRQAGWAKDARQYP